MSLTCRQRRVNIIVFLESRSWFKLVTNLCTDRVFGLITKITRKVTKIIQMLQEMVNFLVVKIS